MTLDNGSINYGEYSFWKKVTIFVGLIIYLAILNRIMIFGFESIESASSINPNIIGVLLILFLVVYSMCSLFIGKKLGLLELDFKWANQKNIGSILWGTFLGLIITMVLQMILYRFEFFYKSSVVIRNFDISTKISFSLTLGVQVAYNIVAVSIAEEILFRGFIMKIAIRNNKYLAIFVSVFMFGLLHYWNSLFSMINAVFVGFILANSYYKTSKLEVPIGIHILYNFVAVMIL